MRWKDREGSENVEDRRRASPGGMMIGGGLGTLAIIVIALLLGINPQQLLQQAPNAQVGRGNGPAGPVDPAQEELKKFVSVVLRDTEDVWTKLFAQMGARYEKPKLVIFTQNVRSGCGLASAGMGPFYCPADRSVYIDLAFYEELKRKFKAPGDFAQAYVIAHEVGHHVQNLLGTSDRVHAMQQRVGKVEANQLSVRLELQADYLAGVWAHHAQKMFNALEPGDIDEAINAASAIGDDKLQEQAQGHVQPDLFTHGTSEQRIRWFKMGLQSGDPRRGDTFNTDRL